MFSHTGAAPPLMKCSCSARSQAFVMLLVGVWVGTYGRGMGRRWGRVGNFVAFPFCAIGPRECCKMLNPHVTCLRRKERFTLRFRHFDLGRRDTRHVCHGSCCSGNKTPLRGVKLLGLDIVGYWPKAAVAGRVCVKCRLEIGGGLRVGRFVSILSLYQLNGNIFR